MTQPMTQQNNNAAHKRTPVRTSTPQPQAGEFLEVAPETIHVGGINPRRTFDEEKLNELVESVRAKGVLEPLLVRPLPKPKGKSRFQLVAGERRLRAALRAKLRVVPVISRAYTDQEALEIAVVENEQRQDVPILEKAEGYQRLMKEFNYSAEALAARINKSEAHVHSTVKLLRVPEIAKKHLNDGTISKSHAELIARVPNQEGREKLARDIIFNHGGNTVNPVSVREAKRLADHYTQELSKATFDTKDEDLVKGAPACTVCPYKSGNNRLEYPEGRADICNNVACFNNKTEAGRALRLAALTEKRGAIPLSKEDIKKYLPYGYLDGNAPYVKLDDCCHQDKKYRNFRQLVGKELGKSVRLFVAVKERDGSILELALKSEVKAVLKSRYNIDLNARAGAGKEAAQQRMRSQARGLVVHQALGLVATFFQKQCAGGFSAKFGKYLRLAAGAMLHNVSNDALREVAKRRQLEIKGQYPRFAAELEKAATHLSGAELFGLLMEAGIAESLHYWKGPYSSTPNKDTHEILKTAGIDLNQLEAAELKEIKARRAEREKKAGGKKGGQKSPPKTDVADIA